MGDSFMLHFTKLSFREHAISYAMKHVNICLRTLNRKRKNRVMITYINKTKWYLICKRAMQMKQSTDINGSKKTYSVKNYCCHKENSFY